MEQNLDFFKERYELTMGKVRRIVEEGYGDEAFRPYFAEVAAFICLMDEYYAFVLSDGLKKASLEELRAWNHKLYQDILPERYGSSFTDPAFAVEKLGKEFGGLLSALYAEVRSMIIPVTEKQLEEMLIRMELFVEVYSSFEYEWLESLTRPAHESIRQILYWYVSDYSEIAAEAAVRNQVDPDENYAAQVMLEADLSDIRYLYRYGEYVTENEEQGAFFLASLPSEEIDLMAEEYLKKYAAGWDGTREVSIEISYLLGTERMVVRAIEKLTDVGCRPVIRRSPAGILQGEDLHMRGVMGPDPNRQYVHDHKEDMALIWDKALVQRKLEVLRTVFEKYKDKAVRHVGPARECWQEAFEPERKPHVMYLSKEQEKMAAEYKAQAESIRRKYFITQF